MPLRCFTSPPPLSQVFTALALVGMVILPLNNFPWVLNGILEAKVSLDRIQHFLDLADQDLDAYYSKGTAVRGSGKEGAGLGNQDGSRGTLGVW